MNFVTIEKESSLNGEGLRNVLWVTGCSHHCKGCHNPETWDPNYGQEFSEEVHLPMLLEGLKPKYISGLTISGGDPFFIDNIDMMIEIIKAVRKEFEQTKSIWLYTGYKVEDLMNDVDANGLYAVLTNLYKKCPEIINYSDYYDYTKNYYSSLDYHTKMKIKSILYNIDVLVDGKFEEDKKIEGLRYKGSWNQRIINMRDKSDLLYDEKINIELTEETLRNKE